MPYSLLLSRTTRESIGLSLKDNIVIVDEAHNLIDAISQLNSCVLTLKDVQRSRNHLGQYLSRYQKRLLGKNIVYIKQISYILSRLEGTLLSLWCGVLHRRRPELQAWPF